MWKALSFETPVDLAEVETDMNDLSSWTWTNKVCEKFGYATPTQWRLAYYFTDY